MHRHYSVCIVITLLMTGAQLVYSQALASETQRKPTLTLTKTFQPERENQEHLLEQVRELNFGLLPSFHNEDIITGAVRSGSLTEPEAGKQLQNRLGELLKRLGVRAVFDPTIEGIPVHMVTLPNLAPCDEIDFLLRSNGLGYELLEARKILVFPESQRDRYEFREAVIYNLRNTAAEEELLALIKDLLAEKPGSRVSLLKSQHTVQVVGSRLDQQRVRTLLKLLDEQLPQVKLRVDFFASSRDLGFESGAQISPQAAIQSASAQLAQLPEMLLGILGERTTSTHRASLEVFAEHRSQVEVKFGRQIPIPSATGYFPGPESNLLPFPSGRLLQLIFGFDTRQQFTAMEYRDIGINLKFTPIVQDDLQSVRLEMRMEASNATTAVSRSKGPVIDTATIATTITIPFGKTFGPATIDQKIGGKHFALLPLSFQRTKRDLGERLFITFTPEIAPGAHWVSREKLLGFSALLQ